MLKRSISFLFLFGFLVNPVLSQCITICSWNIANFGKSKSDAEITFIAKTINEADIVAIQEVSSSPPGPHAIAKLTDELNRLGSKWSYVVSPPTVGKGIERYAFVYKSSNLKLAGKPFLEKSLELLIDREPFLARFTNGFDTILLATIHTIPSNKNPYWEIQVLYKLDSIYSRDRLMVLGDFNSSHKSPAFTKLINRGFSITFLNTKTTYKMKPDPATGNHLANEYDNIYFERKAFELQSKIVTDFSKNFPDLKSARQISDHLPVFGCFLVR